MKIESSEKYSLKFEENSEHFSNCFLPFNSKEGRLMAFNDKYLAFYEINPSQIKLVDPNKTINLFKDYSTIFRGKPDVLDMEFSPFNNEILSFSGGNNVYIYKIDEKKENNTDLKESSYKSHFNRVNMINFNPVASNIMCSGSSDSRIDVWESIEFKTYTSLKIKNEPNSIFWSPNGDLIGMNTKNNYFMTFDPRMKNITNSVKTSFYNTNSKFAWIDNNTIAIIYWPKNNEKILGLLDLRKYDNLKLADNYFTSIEINKNNFSTIPYVNPELKLIYTVGKEESLIRVFGYNTGSLEKISELEVSELNKFSFILNRQYLNKEKLEIDRFARYTNDKNIFFDSFYLENNKDFEGILYPYENFTFSQMTEQDWISGKKFETIPNKINQTTNPENSDKNNSLDKIQSQNKLNEIKNNNNNKERIKTIKKRISPNKIINNQTPQRRLSYQFSFDYKSLEKDYSYLEFKFKKLKYTFKEKEKDYNNQISASNEKLKVEKNKFKEEINRYKNLLENKNNQDIQSSNILNQNKNKDLENKNKEQQQIINDLKKREEKSLKTIADLEDKINQKNSLLKQKEIEIQNKIK